MDSNNLLRSRKAADELIKMTGAKVCDAVKKVEIEAGKCPFGHG